jgi:hypothetical protein
VDVRTTTRRGPGGLDPVDLFGGTIEFDLRRPVVTKCVSF